MLNLFRKSILFSVVFILWSSAFSQDSLFIKGKISGLDSGDKNLALSDITTNPPVVSTKVTSQDGSFSFKVAVSKLAIYRLYLTADNFIMLLMTGQDIDLQLNAEKLNLNPVISGSDDTRILYDMAIQSSLYDMQLDSLNKAFGEARKAPELSEQLPVIQSAYEKTSEKQLDFIRQKLMANPGSPATLFFIDKLSLDSDLDVFRKVSAALYAKYPEHSLVVDLKNRVELEEKLQPGNMAPEITLPDRDGKPVSLSSMRGKVVLIDFWASWCGPCRRDNPEVVRMYNRFKDKGFDIFGVSLDRDAASWLAAIEKDGLTWTHVSDLKYWQSAGAEAYGVKAIPHTVLIDREGKIIARKLRGKALEDKLEEILGK